MRAAARRAPSLTPGSHDALRAHGVIPPKPPSRSPSPEPPSAAEQREEQRKRATVTDLDEELEEASDEEEHILQRLRADRMRELAASQRSARFGRVYPISRPDYTREVTEASREQNPDPTTKLEGTGVVCYLYSPSMETCKLMSTFLDALAAKYPHSKFVSIVGSQCIPDYPDKNLPTLLIYRNGELRRQIIGLRREIGLDGMNTKQEGACRNHMRRTHYGRCRAAAHSGRRDRTPKARAADGPQHQAGGPRGRARGRAAGQVDPLQDAGGGGRRA